ncbi:MAG: glycerophosphodiester phosphodiesterase family protein, partial [Kiloniellales bacterium]|nr:glycerophosphodiester phosphodiesterase family protein [Kiloniellales bacterium]
MSRGSKGFLVLTLLLIPLAILSLVKDPANRPNALSELPLFDLQGHRGARGLYPENTLEGMEATMTLGVSTLEMDVVPSADGVLVLYHDLRLNPFTTRDKEGRWIEGEGAAV